MQYATMLTALQSGIRFPAEQIDAVLTACGRTHEGLVRDLHATDYQSAGFYPGKPCERCGRPLTVRTTRRAGLVAVRYFRCPGCGDRPGRQIVPASAIQHRTKHRCINHATEADRASSAVPAPV